MNKIEETTSLVKRIESLSEFNRTVLDGDLTIVKFTMERCAPCKRIAPVFETLAMRSRGTRLQFVEVKLDKNEDMRRIISHYHVRYFPCFLLIKVDPKSNDEANVVYRPPKFFPPERALAETIKMAKEGVSTIR